MMEMGSVTTEIGGIQEGRTTRAIERQTSRIPSGAYLALAIGSIVGSAALMVSSRTRRFGRVERSGLANFVGQWAPTLLVIGLYNKVVKLERELIGD
jgi:hypothetical protein